MRRDVWAVLLVLVVALHGVRADEAAAVKAIEKLGGDVYRDEKSPRHARLRGSSSAATR